MILCIGIGGIINKVSLEGMEKFSRFMTYERSNKNKDIGILVVGVFNAPNCIISNQERSILFFYVFTLFLCKI